MRNDFDDLLRYLFQIDPAKRLTAEQVLEHSLFKGVAENLNFNKILDLERLIESGVIVKIYYEKEGLMYAETRPVGMKVYRREADGKLVTDEDTR